MKSVFRLQVPGIFLGGILCTGVCAQSFPSQPLRLIVPYTPGAATDAIARPLAQGLGEALGQNVLVEHRPGGNTIVGAEQAARAKPDGHTLLLATVSTLGVNPAAYKNLSYDVVKDFDPVAKVASSYHVVVARTGFAPNSIAELVAYEIGRAHV